VPRDHLYQLDCQQGCVDQALPQHRLLLGSEHVLDAVSDVATAGWTDQRVVVVVDVPTSTAAGQGAADPMSTNEFVLTNVAALVVVGVLIGCVEAHAVDGTGVVGGQRISHTAFLHDEGRGWSRGGLVWIAADILLALRLWVLVWHDGIGGPATTVSLVKHSWLLSV